MPTIALKGVPNPKQEQFFLADHRHIAYGGARGGGKSWAMRRKMILRRMCYPGTTGLLLRRTYPELYANHVLPLLMELQGIATYNSQNHVFNFPNGSKLFLGYCDTEADVLRYQGQEYEDIGLEEATQFTEYQMQFLKTCNRTVNPDIKPRMYYTANPGGVGHAWFKRLFVDQQYSAGEKPDEYQFIQAKVYDNPVLMDNNPEYIDNLKSLPEDMRRAFLDGDWDIFAGQYFREFRRDLHVIEPIAMPAWWERFISIDWGYNDPCAVLWHAVGPDSRVYTYRELYITQTIASDVAKQIKELSTGEDVRYGVMSPDAWAQRGNVSRGESIAETFLVNGVPVRQADNNRLNGWQRMHEYLALAPDGIPYWQIFSGCQNLIRTLPALIHDDHRVEDVSGKGEDHCGESARYALMTRMGQSTKPKQRSEDDDEGDAETVSMFN